MQINTINKTKCSSTQQDPASIPQQKLSHPAPQTENSTSTPALAAAQVAAALTNTSIPPLPATAPPNAQV